MKLSVLCLTLLSLLPSFIVAAALPDFVPRNETIAKRGGEVNYLADCSRLLLSSGDSYQASYIAWYSNVDNSQNEQRPDSLSSEYRDWSRGGEQTAIFQATHFPT